MKYCEKCGAEMEDNAKYCPKCGGETKITELKELQNRRNNQAISNFVCSILALCLGIIGYFVFGFLTIVSFSYGLGSTIYCGIEIKKNRENVRTITKATLVIGIIDMIIGFFGAILYIIAVMGLIYE